MHYESGMSTDSETTSTQVINSIVAHTFKKQLSMYYIIDDTKSTFCV